MLPVENHQELEEIISFSSGGTVICLMHGVSNCWGLLYLHNVRCFSNGLQSNTNVMRGLG